MKQKAALHAPPFVYEPLIFIASLDEDLYALEYMNITNTLTRAGVGTLALLLLITPFGASAASSRTSCSLDVSTAQGEKTITKDGEILLTKGDTLSIDWDSKLATKALLNRKTIATSGADTFTPTKNTEYEFVFSNGRKNATCSVEVMVVTGDITNSTLITDNEKPMLLGTATGVKTVQVVVTKKGETKSVFTSKVAKVKSGKWSAKISKPLEDGTYTVKLLGPKSADLNTITSETLTVGEAGTTITVSSIPLLMGGTARANMAAPVAYLQLRNTGSEAAKVNGFWLKQNGTASTNSIVGFSTIDEKGGSKAESDTSKSSTLFKNGLAFAPSAATIESGQTKLFTVKALMASNLSAYVGSNLMLDVTGVDVEGSVTSKFPLRGTTFVIGY